MAKLANLSIRNKLVLIQSVTAFIAVLVCATIFVLNDIKAFKASSVKKMYSLARIVGDNCVSPLEFADDEAAGDILQNLGTEIDITDAIVLDSSGAVFARYTRDGAEGNSLPQVDSSLVLSSRFLDKKLIVVYRILHDGEYLGTVVIKSELTELDLIIYNYIILTAFVLIAGLIAAILISVFLQRVISDRLIMLVTKTKTVSETGDYSIRALPEGKDEIADLTSEFNNMLEQIEDMQEKLKGANVELEKRVKMRTSELEAANKRLQLTSDELAHSNSELEQFAYVASHDLQEPLRTIANFVGLINTKYAGNLDQDADKYIGYILKATTRMQDLIKDLLEFSRIGSNVDFMDVDCAMLLELVKEELRIVIEQSKAEITSDPLPVITANNIEMKRVFQNLITNAIKFRKKNDVCRIHISAAENDHEYHFTFKDNGIGIEEQYKERIFIIFQRLHSMSEYTGTGIGLATCKKIVALHNGKIWVESKFGEGSTFHFTISKSIINDKK